MVRVRANRSEVELAPLGGPEDGPNDDWVSYPVRLVRAADVDGWPNLLGTAAGRTMTALFRRGRVAVLSGPNWVTRAELVAPGVLRVRDDLTDL